MSYFTVFEVVQRCYLHRDSGLRIAGSSSRTQQVHVRQDMIRAPMLHETCGDTDAPQGLGLPKA